MTCSYARRERHLHDAVASCSHAAAGRLLYRIVNPLSASNGRVFALCASCARRYHNIERYE